MYSREELNKSLSKFGFSFENLRQPEKLRELLNIFLSESDNRRVMFLSREKDLSAGSFMALARETSFFLSNFFGIEREVQQLKNRAIDFLSISELKVRFIRRRVLRGEFTNRDSSNIDLFIKRFGSLTKADLAREILRLCKLKDEISLTDVSIAGSLFSMAIDNSDLQRRFDLYDLLKEPYVPDADNPVGQLKARDVGFLGSTVASGDSSFETRDIDFLNAEKIACEAERCLRCHPRGKDYCSFGKVDSKGNFERSIFGYEMTGCPLKERISEIDCLKTEGDDLAALVGITVHNPLCILTGHRICGDCSQSCIFSGKGETIDFPLIETGILTSVLNLPWGFEIYCLLTAWNPLRIRAYPESFSDRRILICGSGPAGSAVALESLNAGFGVCMIDGAKIESLPPSLSGKNKDGSLAKVEPVYSYESEIADRSENRISTGFGGVADYGITSRWDKSFLIAARLLLERREYFTLVGGVRFGGSITSSLAFEMGFDHVCLALGAGRPKNFLPRRGKGLPIGVMTAADFLMTINVGAPYKKNSPTAAPQIRMPVFVIGAGLTALDAAAEALIWYPNQVLIFLERFERVEKIHGKGSFFASLTNQEKKIAMEFLHDGRYLKNLKLESEKANIKFDPLPFMLKKGGATIVCRKKIKNAKFCVDNISEGIKAFSSGVSILENSEVSEFITGSDGTLDAIAITDNDGKEKQFKAGTILLATGTERNGPEIAMEDNLLQIDENGNLVLSSDDDSAGEDFFAGSLNGRKVSCVGDMHPKYSGSVVKAMAGAFSAFSKIELAIKKIEFDSPKERIKSFVRKYFSEDFYLDSFEKTFVRLFTAQVLSNNRICDQTSIIEIMAPMSSLAFKPGLFYKIQTFEFSDTGARNPHSGSEGVVVTGANVNREKGNLTIAVIGSGASTTLCKNMKQGDHIIFNGPSGIPSNIPSNANLVLVGGGLGNAALLPIAEEAKNRGCSVLLFSGYMKPSRVFMKEEAISSASFTVFSFERDLAKISINSNVLETEGTVIDALESWQHDLLSNVPFKICDTDAFMMAGSDKMMQAVKNFISRDKLVFNKVKKLSYASLNAPMNCILKGLCARCLVEDNNGELFLACAKQDMLIDSINFDSLHYRLSQHSLLERITALYLSPSLS